MGMPASEFKHIRSYKPELFTLCDCNQCLDTSEEPKQWNGSLTCSISLNWWILLGWDHRSWTQHSATEATPWQQRNGEELPASAYFILKGYRKEFVFLCSLYL